MDNDLDADTLKQASTVFNLNINIHPSTDKLNGNFDVLRASLVLKKKSTYLVGAKIASQLIILDAV